MAIAMRNNDYMSLINFNVKFLNLCLRERKHKGNIKRVPQILSGKKETWKGSSTNPSEIQNITIFLNLCLGETKHEKVPQICM